MIASPEAKNILSSSGVLWQIAREIQDLTSDKLPDPVVQDSARTMLRHLDAIVGGSDSPQDLDVVRMSQGIRETVIQVGGSRGNRVDVEVPKVRRVLAR